ncbi:MAG TPA: peptidoglycan-binding domain-containing protein, partial [Candidatus Udaeobacter sp.]|nr:peptidoglycan-binding domain-containing protein [Candidatus Udaeobacter sp.]
MKAKIAALILIGSLMLARADQMIESVQQALKDQGFYYGEITGQTSSDLTAAIRRYQIRSGLR